MKKLNEEGFLIAIVITVEHKGKGRVSKKKNRSYIEES
jgi:hypothetical protein